MFFGDYEILEEEEKQDIESHHASAKKSDTVNKEDYEYGENVHTILCKKRNALSNRDF